MVEGTNTFAAPANTTLNPQTNYFISVNEATPTRTWYERTSSDGTTYFIYVYEGTPVGERAVYEFTGRGEQSGADGWSIDDRGTCKTLLDQEPDPPQGTGLGAIGNDFWLERRFVPPSEEPDRGVGFCFGLVFGVRA